MSTHVLSVVGARPQFVKAAAFSRACAAAGVDEIILHTGQHYDDVLSEHFFRDLEIPRPWLNLAVGSSSASKQIGEIMVGFERAVRQLASPPDWVVVFGDTNTTIAASLAAVKMGYPLAHVEAGLRSFNRSMPEEVNRVVVDRIATALFCPNSLAVENLRAEGITSGVFEVGDLMYDALRLFAPVAQAKFNPRDLVGEDGEYVVATIHRAENTDDSERLASVLRCLAAVPSRVIWPIHPRTRDRIAQFNLEIPNQVVTIDPVGYLEMLSLISRAKLVLTDSGGVQREAYWLGRRCITLREETEWTETLHGNWNSLVGADVERLQSALGNQVSGTPNLPESDEMAGTRIVAVLTGSAWRGGIRAVPTPPF